MKKYSKILVLILSLALICTGLILAVSAEDETPTFDLVSAIKNAADGDTIVMTGNAEITDSHGDQWGAVAVNKNLTVDLNGYTLTTSHPNRAFNVQTVGKLFTITGSGTINATGGDLFKVGGNDHTGLKMNVIGTGKGITINHSGASNVLDAPGGTFKFENVTVNSSATENVFHLSGNNGLYLNNVTINHTGTKNLIYATNGTVEVKNTTVTTSTADNVFFNNSTAAMSFVGVNVTTSTMVDGQKSVFCPNTMGTVSLDYCRVETKGHSIFTAPSSSTKVENYIVVDHSYLWCSYGNGGYTSLIYNSYGNLASDVIISNSLVSWNSRILVKHSLNNTALIFRNTEILYNGKQGNFFRTLNVKLEEGSWMHGNHTYYANDTTFYSNYDNNSPMTVGDNTSVYLLLSEGARFDEATYNKLINRLGVKKDDSTATVVYYNEGFVAYPDGSSPTNSETYKMVYDPAGNPDAPYVVVTADKADVITDQIVFTNNPTTTLVWHGTGTAKNYNFDQNSFFKFTSNGKLNADNTAPNYVWGLKHGNGISAKDHGVFVFEFDVATDSEVGFNETYVNIHARGDAAGSGNKGNSGNLLLIKQDGSIEKPVWNAETKADTYEKTDLKLALNDWNHITIVVDTTSPQGLAYVYVNGVLANTHVAYDEGAYLFGPRFNVTANGAKDTNASFLIDNVMIRTGEGAVTDNGESYLVNGGKAWNSNRAYSNAASIGGINIKPDVESILALQNELGVVVKINKDIIEPQSVVNEGTVLTNGHSINVAKGSVAYKIELGTDGSEYGSYVFDDAFAALVAKYQFYTSLKFDEASLADPANWTEVGETDVTTVLSTLYTGSAFPVIGKYSDSGYLTSTHIGWTDILGSSELRNSPATEEEARSGEVIKLYPVLNFTKAYTIVILDANGEFNRGFTGTTFWGSGLRKFEMKYGETLVLNANVISQATISQVFGNSPDPANASCFKTAAGATEEKYNNFDFNGFTWTVDTNYGQNGAKGKAMAFAVYKGETLNIYSSRPGGAYVAYGNATDSKGEYSASGGTFLSFYGNSGAEDKISANANGEVTQNNTKVNVGTVTVDGKTIPGSNLSIYTAVIADVQNGDNTCEVNFDGVKAVKNSADYGGMFITRKYFGKLNITNSTIINAVNENVFHGHEQGYVAATETTPEERALSDVTVDNCLILTHANGGDVINKDYSFNTIKFTNCVTNGKLIKDDFGALVLGEGNKATEMSGNALAEGVVRAKWNNAMPLSADVSAPYFTLVDQTFTSADDDYNDLAFLFSIGAYEGEDGIALPILGYATVPTAEALDVTYVNAKGEEKVEKYAVGANVVITPEDYTGTVINAAHKGTWTVNEIAGSALPTNIQENVTVVAEYDAVVNISGLKANLSLYSDFVINVYIPADYAQYVTAVNGAALAGETVTIGEKQYYKVTASKVAKEASDAAVFEIALAESGYTATKIVNVSITDYASTILAGEFTDADKILMYNMLSFVGAASKYFEGAEDTVIAGLLETYAAWNKVSVDKSYANALEDTGLGDAFASAGIVLGDAPAFTLVPNGNFAGTVTVTYGDGNVRTYTVNAGSTEAIKIEGMKIFNFGVNINITAVGTIAGVEGEQTVSGTLNLDTYAKYQTENGADGVVAVVEALYNYVKVAEQYKAGTLVLPEEAPAE